MQLESKFLSKRELKALIKIGNILIPKNDPFPSFSEIGCIKYVDDALENLDPYDLSDLKLFFKLMSILPKFLSKLILLWMNSSKISLLRLGNLGIRGIVFTLYYSNKTASEYSGQKTHDLIGYHVKSIPKGA
ncbi:MAG: hypothetical protein ACFFD1_01485 [Candidatus Thorarchaeota archaeon]